MYYVGLDLHWKTSTLHILDDHGRSHKSMTIHGGWPKLREAFTQLPRPFGICFEASTGYGTMVGYLTNLAERIVVAHPGQLRVIAQSKRKNDRVDAEWLAKLLYADLVPQVHVPSVDVREWRGLIEFRRRQIDKRTRVKNSVRALLRTHGIVKPREIRGLWTRKGIAWLKAVEWPATSASLRCTVLLAELESLEKPIAQLTAELNRIAQDHSAVQLVMTIPGIGPRTAETLIAYLDQHQRFARVSQVGAYFGLVPRQHQSGSHNHLGRITKDGPATARKLLIEAAWTAVRKCPRVRAIFDRIAKGERERRKKAVVAVAHYLLRCAFAMLRSGEPWRPAA